MIHPVSVVIPHTKSRKQFFESVCLPSVERNNPAQIIIVDRVGGACEKRNEGASKAMYDLVLFVDDDGELLPGAIQAAIQFLELDPGAAFAYGDRIVFDHTPPPREIKLPSSGWNLESLRRANYIDTTSLLRKKFFPGFDNSLKRFQDWDLWLTIAARGGRGIYVRRPLHRSHRIDKGISDTYGFDEHREIIVKKHGLV